MTPDVLVIGGGILGAGAALKLARAGLDVMLVERGAMFREASGVNAGGFAIQTTAPEITPQATASVEMWSRMSETLGEEIGFKRTGGYRVATSAAEAEMLRATHPRLAGLGLSMQWIDTPDLRRDMPWFGPAIVGASYCAEEGFAVPMQAGAAFRRALVRAGVRVAEHAPVERVGRDAGGLFATGALGTIRPSRILVAAGAWNGMVAEGLGVRLPMILKTFMLTVTERAPRFMAAIITHARRNLTMKQYDNGTCVIGGGWPGIGGLDPAVKEVDVPVLGRNLAHAIEVVPYLAHVGVNRVWAGLEGATTDELPLMGRLPGHDDVFMLGCVRGGFVLGPLLAGQIADLMLGQPVAGIEAFSPQRFAQAAADVA